MPRTLASIPEILVGNITQGEVVLRNVVVSPHFARDDRGGIYTAPIDVVNPWKPPTDGGIRPQLLQGAQQFDDRMTPADFAKLAPDTRVIFIDGDEIIDASREEAPDFMMNGAYFIGAFAPQTAQAVIQDMINNPIMSPEEQNAGNIAQIMKAQAAFALTALTYFNAYLDTDKAWDNFQGLSDIEEDVLTTPPVVKAPEAPKNFPAEREIMITYSPDYTGDTAVLGRRVYNEIISKASKAVLSSSQRHDGKEAGSTAYNKYVIWIPDSVTDIQVLEAIGSIMKADMNVSILSKRLTGMNAAVIPDRSGITPLLDIPEPNKAVVADKYQQILTQMESISPVIYEPASTIVQSTPKAGGMEHVWYDEQGRVQRCNTATSPRGMCPPPMPMPKVIPNPVYQSLKVKAQEIERKGGVPAGCAPQNPQVLPPNVVPSQCLKPRPAPPPKPPPVKLPTKPAPGGGGGGSAGGGIGKP